VEFFGFFCCQVAKIAVVDDQEEALMVYDVSLPQEFSFEKLIKIDPTQQKSRVENIDCGQGM